MFLALKEMRRAKARFSLLAGAVGLLVFLILFQQALLSGLVNQFIGALKNQSGEVLVYNEQARKNLEGSIILPEQQAAIAAVEGVEVASPLGEGTFTVIAGGTEKDAVIFGYDLGKPGAPTTTLLSIAGGLLTPTDGTVVVGGHDISEYTAKQLTAFRRDNVGFVFQSVNLVPFLTAEENCSWSTRWVVGRAAAA